MAPRKIGSWRNWTSRAWRSGLRQEQEQARKLLVKWEHQFACSDLDLGKTFPHQTLNWVDWLGHPLKSATDKYSPYAYDDMKAHLQEMLDIVAIQKLHSLWASTVVLVQKKDGSLRFCIDLRKLNSQTVKGCILTTPDWWDPWQPAGVPVVLLTWPEVWVLAGQDGWGEQAADCVYHGAIGILWVRSNALQTDQCPCHLSAADGNLHLGTLTLIGVSSI